MAINAAASFKRSGALVNRENIIASRLPQPALPDPELSLPDCIGSQPGPGCCSKGFVRQHFDVTPPQRTGSPRMLLSLPVAGRPQKFEMCPRWGGKLTFRSQERRVGKE